jgi:hypothetical protein
MVFVTDVIQPLVSLGYNLASRFLGTPFIHYRPRDSGPPLTSLNMIDTLNLGFDKNPNFEFVAPGTYSPVVYFALLDLTTVKIGDYLYDHGGLPPSPDGFTFFVANIEQLKPALLIQCNATIDVFRPGDAGQNPTAGYYSTNSNPTPIMTGWPVSLVQESSGPKNEAHLPSSVRTPDTTILLPFSASVDILYGDIITDDLNRRYEVKSNNLTSLGWQLMTEFMSP